MTNFKNSIVLTIVTVLCMGQYIIAEKDGTIANGTNRTIMLRLIKHGLWTDWTLKPKKSTTIDRLAFDSAEFHIKPGRFDKRPYEMLTISLKDLHKDKHNWNKITLVERDGKFEIIS